MVNELTVQFENPCFKDKTRSEEIFCVSGSHLEKMQRQFCGLFVFLGLGFDCSTITRTIIVLDFLQAGNVNH